ncbi:uncharacterized protein LOC144331908 isoform X6 [Macaca mulatta]
MKGATSPSRLTSTVYSWLGPCPPASASLSPSTARSPPPPCHQGPSVRDRHVQDCSGLCFCTRHQLPALMTSTSPPAWSDTVVTTSARPDDGLFLRCSPQCKDEDDNEVGDDDDDDGDVKCGLQSLPMEVRCRQKQQQRPGFLRNCSQFEEGRKSHLQ